MLDVRLAQRLRLFLDAASKMRQDLYTKMYGSGSTAKPLTAMEGSRYIRIVQHDTTQRYCYCFVDKTNGDVLKSAGWKAPAKHARSNIWDADLGVSGLGPHGAKYLK